MSGPFKISLMLLALGVFTLGTATSSYAQGQGERRNGGAKVQNGGGQNGPRAGSRMGNWLRQYHGKSFDQQKQSLENDPDFKKLPPERQEQLRQRLQNFNNLPPAQQERVIQRLDKLNRMSPEQRAQARALWDRMRLLPEERRTAVRQFFHSLVGMNHEQRQRMLGSPQFNSNFSPDERDIIQRGLELNDENNSGGPNETPR